MAEINDNDGNVDSSEIDFTELDGQLELIVQHLEKRDKKKAVSYYLKESTIERIKTCAQNFNMKDSQFLEEAINKLMDVIENRNQQGTSTQAPSEHTSSEKAAEKQSALEPKLDTDASEKHIVTPWGRLAEVKRANIANQSNAVSQSTVANQPNVVSQSAVVKQVITSGVRPEVNTESGKDAELGVNVKSDIEATEPVVSVDVIDSKQLEQLEAKLIDYIFNNYRPDYRMLYRRFEQIVQSELSIQPHILIELVSKLDKQGELTYYAKQNLIDINKKLFEARIPNLKENFKYFEDDDFIE